jgi:hypothetical protein
MTDLEMQRIARMTEQKFASDPPSGFRYDPRKRNEASYDDTGIVVIVVGPKFFRLDLEGREKVIAHEVGHALSDLMLDDLSAFRLADEGAFGPKRPDGTIDGINGTYTPGENAAEAYALLVTEPDWLEKHYPQAFCAVGCRALREGFWLPDGVVARLRSNS